MKVLLTNHFLLNFRGSEIFTFEIAKSLVENHHAVTVYSKYLNPKIVELFTKSNIEVVDSLLLLKNRRFDVAHIHHNIVAYEVRLIFPSLPMIFLSHGVIHCVENPPIIDLGIYKYLAVSEEVKFKLMQNGIKSEIINIFRNCINPDIFFPTRKICYKPTTALIISNSLPEAKERIIVSVLKNLGIKYKMVGKKYGMLPNVSLPKLINQADIVFSIGRGVIESMFCGRIPVIFDYLGGDGLVTPHNIFTLMQCNFSGRYNKIAFTTDSLEEEIKKYKQSDGIILRNIALQLFSIKNNIKHLLEIYKEACTKNVPRFDPFRLSQLKHIVDIVSETKLTTERMFRDFKYKAPN